MKPIGKPEVETIGVLLSAFLGQVLLDLLSNQFLMDLIVIVPLLFTLAWYVTHLWPFKNRHRRASLMVVKFAHADIGLLSGVAAGILAAGMSGLISVSIAIGVLAVIAFVAGIVIGFAFVGLMKASLGFKDS